jgi:hypothetical protein
MPDIPTFNVDCEECVKKQKHCGHCPNTQCQSCLDVGEFCGYCGFGCIDHALWCDKKLTEEGLDKQFYVRVSNPFELQIDCDHPDDVKFCLAQMKVIKETIGIKGYVITKSKSGNRHVIIRTKRCMDEFERIALQACLGSDRKRELLSLYGVMEGHGNPILLIENGHNPQLQSFDAKFDPSLVDPMKPSEDWQAIPVVNNSVTVTYSDAATAVASGAGGTFTFDGTFEDV